MNINERNIDELKGYGTNPLYKQNFCNQNLLKYTSRSCTFSLKVQQSGIKLGSLLTYLFIYLFIYLL